MHDIKHQFTNTKGEDLIFKRSSGRLNALDKLNSLDALANARDRNLIILISKIEEAIQVKSNVQRVKLNACLFAQCCEHWCQAIERKASTLASDNQF